MTVGRPAAVADGVGPAPGRAVRRRPTAACCGRWPRSGTGALSNAELYQQVRVERERLASITLNIGEGVCAIDADGKLTFVNPAAADMIELPPLSVTIDEPVSDGAIDGARLPARARP